MYINSHTVYTAAGGDHMYSLTSIKFDKNKNE